jgi:hypothetical protein
MRKEVLNACEGRDARETSVAPGKLSGHIKRPGESWLVSDPHCELDISGSKQGAAYLSEVGVLNS